MLCCERGEEVRMSIPKMGVGRGLMIGGKRWKRLNDRWKWVLLKVREGRYGRWRWSVNMGRSGNGKDANT